MELSTLGITPAKSNQFNTKGINSVEELLQFIPRKYLDFSKETGINLDAEYSCFKMYVNSVKSYINKTPMIAAFGFEFKNKRRIKVLWFRKQFMLPKISDTVNKTVYVCGKVVYDKEYDTFSVTEPIIFSPDIANAKKIYPVYSKIHGMSDDYLKEKITMALSYITELSKDITPYPTLSRFNLLSKKEAITELHRPSSMERLTEAKKRTDFDDLLYFALRLEDEKRSLPTGTPFVIKSMKKYREFINSLPYDLTPDQKKVLDYFLEKARDCRRISSLVCGDVGSGKTVVIQALSVLFAENGYQVGILCPSVALANQHLKDTQELLGPLGINVALYRGASMKAKEKREMLEKIKNGEIDIVIGTHAILGNDVVFKDLALACVDEEQKFSVLQRQALSNKARTAAVNVATFSATPIPLSLFKALSSISLDVQTIKTKPANRIPPKCAITSKQSEIFRVMEREIRAGRQAYVVSPMIDATEKSNGESVEELSKIYKDYFEPKGIKVATLTGRDSREYMADVFEKFGSNEVQIMIASTIIETGINFKNANCLALYGGKYLGLSSAHQIRGRILRGGFTPYFMVYSEDKDNERLKMLVSTDDGFAISEYDLKFRSQGQLIDGYAQHGKDKYVELMMANMFWFKEIQEEASKLLDNGIGEQIIENYKKE